MKKLIFFLVLFITACAEHRDTGYLVNGYKVVAMNPLEVYVATPTNELIIGPTIKSMGVTGDIVVVDCGLEKSVVNGFENTTGFNIVDTRTGVVTYNLTEESMKIQLSTLHAREPEMQSPSVLMHSRMTDREIGGKLSGHYELKWDRSDNILTKGNAKSSNLVINKDGTFLLKCVDGRGIENTVTGQWTQNDDWINFDVFYDCVGAWPNTGSESTQGAGLHFSLGSTPVIVVEPDLNVIYVAKE
jgi:hypothetical protein